MPWSAWESTPPGFRLCSTGFRMNTTEGAMAVEDSRSMRNVALMDRIPYFTTLAASHAAALAMKMGREGELGVRALQG